MPRVDLPDMQAASSMLRTYLLETPSIVWHGEEMSALVGSRTRVTVKLELLQRSGSFKARGALINMLALDRDALERGVTTVSSGNHAIATAFAARALGSSAKVVMLSTANEARIELCRRYGGSVVSAPDGSTAFSMAEQISRDEGRALIHPYEGRGVALGTATIGLELVAQAGHLDAVIIPIGGGGLCAGMGAAIKKLLPNCRIYGVEPSGADIMRRSLEAGKPIAGTFGQTIADSLAAPFTTPYTFGLCRECLDDIVLVTDEQIRQAMSLIFRELKMAVEPSAAAATAAIVGPLRDRVRGLRIAMILCGSNIDFATYAGLVAQRRAGTVPA